MSNVLPRGCGRRKSGGVYSMCPTGPGGKEVEEFLFCSPHSLPIDWHDPPRVSFPAIGVQLITDPEGVCHIVDWVGSEHYPNTADFIEETRRLGMSRRLPPNAAILSKLGPRSRHLLIHARAIVRNMGDLLSAANAGEDRYLGNPRAARNHEGCPRQVAWHYADLQGDPTESEPCLGAAWETVEDGQDPEDVSVPAPMKGGATCGFPVYRLPLGTSLRDAMGSTNSEHLGDLHAASSEIHAPRVVRRPFPEGAAVPTFYYFARTAPDGFEPVYAPGIFASFPISHIEVVEGDEEETAVATDAMKDCRVRWEVCPE